MNDDKTKDNAMSELELINFKIPRSTKRRFKSICQSRNQQMTTVLIQYVHEFIKDHQNITDEDYPLEFFQDV